MSVLTPIKTAEDLLKKLRRDVEAFEREVTSDVFVNLTITGYSLVDWVERDTTLPPSARSKTEINGLRNERLIKICGDIANASKHMVLTRRTPIVTAVESENGYGAGRFGCGPFGIGEEQITLEIDGTSVMDARQFAWSLLSYWESFFQRHGVTI